MAPPCLRAVAAISARVSCRPAVSGSWRQGAVGATEGQPGRASARAAATKQIEARRAGGGGRYASPRVPRAACQKAAPAAPEAAA